MLTALALTCLTLGVLFIPALAFIYLYKQMKPFGVHKHTFMLLYASTALIITPLMNPIYREFGSFEISPQLIIMMQLAAIAGFLLSLLLFIKQL